ncbi:MAG: precorrin-6y C5,15-methyltransferase (decarboxylating) subunit CbiE [Kiloniellales bacterium]|nr:precorrin-6y C5,15-methyltransferase (decarboxylating) subunit CbiE [Kiloniellales bacterium]
MTAWLSIVGIGEGGYDDLAPAARALVDTAEVLIGGARHVAMIPEAADDRRERFTWPSPFDILAEEIAKRRGRRVCVLASGDPMDYGVGAKLARRFPLEELAIVPSPSAFSLACARLGWSVPDTTLLSIPGRPLEILHPAVQPGARLLVLTGGVEAPAEVAALLRARGYGASRMVALERMGGPRERRIEGTADDFPAGAVEDFHTLAIECQAAPGAAPLSAAPGLPDDAFRHDGQLTKREVRAATLAALAPVPDQLLWDVGAGCGSVAIEWMRAAARARAVAIERRGERAALIAANAAALGTPSLRLVEGEAPAALADLEDPDAVFVGGGVGCAGLVDACWARLKAGGRLVANAVTLEGERVLLAWRAENGGELTRLAVSRAEPVGGLTGWRPLMPVTQLTAAKP